MKTTAIGDLRRPQFREFLQRELARRCAENPQYSLRAFARALGTDHSTLSQVLRGKRRLTAETIRGLAHALGLARSDAESFVALEDSADGDEGWERHVRQLQDEALEVIAQWQHFALLELVRLESFRPDCRWIARVLDISVDEVNLALTRLLHLGLLNMVDRHTWRDVSEHARAQFDELPAVVAGQLLARIRRATGAAGGDRVLSSSTLAVDRRRIAVVSGYFEKMRRELAELLAGGEAPDDVYQLDLLFYPLTTLHQEHAHGTTRHALSDPREEPGQGGQVLQ